MALPRRRLENPRRRRPRPSRRRRRALTSASRPPPHRRIAPRTRPLTTPQRRLQAPHATGACPAEPPAPPPPATNTATTTAHTSSSTLPILTMAAYGLDQHSQENDSAHPTTTTAHPHSRHRPRRAHQPRSCQVRRTRRARVVRPERRRPPPEPCGPL